MFGLGFFKSKPSKELIDLKYAIYELESHIFANALMKDAFGLTNNLRNKEETTKHWNDYHKLSHEVKDKIKTLESKL